MAQLHSTWIYVCCHRLVSSRQNSIQIPLLGTRRWNRGLASSALSQKFIQPHTRHVEVDRNRGVKIILGRCSQDELIQQPFGVSNSILLFQLNTHRVVSDLAKIIRLACVARQKLYFLFASLTYSLALHVVVQALAKIVRKQTRRFSSHEWAACMSTQLAKNFTFLASQHISCACVAIRKSNYIIFFMLEPACMRSSFIYLFQLTSSHNNFRPQPKSRDQHSKHVCAARQGLLFLFGHRDLFICFFAWAVIPSGISSFYLPLATDDQEELLLFSFLFLRSERPQAGASHVRL